MHASLIVSYWKYPCRSVIGCISSLLSKFETNSVAAMVKNGGRFDLRSRTYSSAQCVELPLSVYGVRFRCSAVAPLSKLRDAGMTPP